MNKRPSWQKYFLNMAYLVSERSTCLRRKVGAVIVRNNQVLSSGYNGAPKRVAHCEETGCLRMERNVPSGQNHELCRGVHAEQNAIVQAAVNGTSLVGATLYCTNHPCSICAKMLINAEIKTIFIGEDYNDKLAKEMFLDAGTEIYLLDKADSTFKKLL